MIRFLAMGLLALGLLSAPLDTHAAEKALCIVCATVEGTNEPETVAAWRTHDGTRYAFCSKKCAEAFDANPAAYLPRAFPRKAPELTMRGFDGRALGWPELAGKVVLVDFWATWCGPCRRSMPHLQTLHEKYGAKGLVVLGVSVDTQAAQKKARDLVKSKKYGYRFAFDSEKSPTWQRYDVQAIPAAFLVDGGGNIVAQWTGLPANLTEMETKIEQALAARP
jgi:thiol-disulfide isomerase/thioredoxin